MNIGSKIVDRLVSYLEHKIGNSVVIVPSDLEVQTNRGGGKKTLLNVGGGSKAFPIPAIYDDYEQILLDVDQRSGADIVCDARSLLNISELANRFDVVYCAHNLEHYYRHDVPTVLAGFEKTLKKEGYVHIIVPDLSFVFSKLANGADLNDVAYLSSAGPIRYSDILYGHENFIRDSGTDWMCHKNGFTERSLAALLSANGFSFVFTEIKSIDLVAFAFLNVPSEECKKRLSLQSFEATRS